MTGNRSHRLSRGLDLPMRVFRTDSCWYESYWLSEPRRADPVIRSLPAAFSKFAVASDRTASILRAALVGALGPTSSYLSTGRRNGVTRAVLLLCTTFILGSTNHSQAQCTARDVLQRQMTFGTAPVIRTPQIPVSSASDVAVWKTIEIGTFSDSSALLGAMRATGCGVGDAAAAALARPAIAVSATKAAVDLVTLSAA